MIGYKNIDNQYDVLPTEYRKEFGITVIFTENLYIRAIDVAFLFLHILQILVFYTSPYLIHYCT